MPRVVSIIIIVMEIVIIKKVASITKVQHIQHYLQHTQFKIMSLEIQIYVYKIVILLELF